MSETKFTPGPWRRNIKPVSQYPAVFAGRNTHLAVVKTTAFSEDTGEANIDLIVAAPDLYLALQLLHDDIADYQRINNLGGYDNHCMKLARAALAKARGEQ